MKRKKFVSASGSIWKWKAAAAWLLAAACVFLVMTDMPVQAAKGHTDQKAEYARFGITVKGSAYYYKGARIRIFFDMRADRSFVNSFADLKGTVDIRLRRGKNGRIQKLEYIPKAEADEILEDMYGFVPSRKKEAAGRTHKQSISQKKAGAETKKKSENTGIQRCERKDVPAGVQAVIKKQCTGSRWYVIKTKDKKYIYYNNLPGDYAFSISGNNLKVRDMGRRAGIYVLLAVDSGFSFKLFYHETCVAYKTIAADG